ncbi:photosystem II repair protein PSB27-H1, chloroplastic [Amaranthus tricolor]|uniref:photosystem II repair protein PSB27-H1, chloroplastic n=1 Tax=Amaranthus tricolor TaxID=29722 RepID=UPI0025881AA8|nr:photosystem II repair protein PSB27-H1, chloroplastic [Amaranthus tricolor]
MASSTLITPTSKLKLLSLTPIKSKLATTTTSAAAQPSPTSGAAILTRRQLTITVLTATLVSPLIAPTANAESNDEYVKETQEVITKVRTTLTKNKTDPDVADAVADLRATSNSWVAKYRREKSLLGKPSFRDMYSALNAVSGHYISFGPTAPIPAKRKARILEEMDSAEKSLLRGR